MRKLLIFLCLFCSLTALAQQKQEITEQDYANQQIEMADSFRAEGKIYVVVAVIVLLLGGLLLYTVSIDRKLSKLEQLAEEKEINKHLA